MFAVVDAAFSPSDRIGALEMQNISVADNRAFLLNHMTATARLGAPANELPELLGEGDPQPDK